MDVVGILPVVMNKRIYGLVLAAGMGRRMGSTKQLLPFGDRTILQTVVDTLLSADLAGVMVVLGHDADAVRNSLTGRDVLFCVNEAYREGMFSSVRCGLLNLPSDVDAVLIALGDQPQIDLSVVEVVILTFRSQNKGIVIPSWDGKRGHPVVIDLSQYLSEILALSGDQGLKPVMRGHPDDTVEIAVEDEGILRDLDSPEDYKAEIERQKRVN